MIDGVELPAITAPEVRIGGEVIDITATPRGRPNGGFITNIRTYQFNTVQRQMIHGGTRVFQDTDALVLIEQLLHEVGTYETGASGHEIQDRTPSGRVSARCCRCSRRGVNRPFTTFSMSANAARFNGQGKFWASRIR